MRKGYMRKLMMVVFVLMVAVAARADTVWLTLEGTGGNNNGSYYVYPYNFALTGSSPTSTAYVAPGSSPAITALICDDFGHDIYVSEHWQATVSTGSAILTNGQMVANGLQTNTTKAYEDAAYLYLQLVANPTSTNSVYINETIWALFNPTAHTDYGSNSTVQSWFSQAQTNSSLADLGKVVLYTPVGGTQVPGTDGLPQEMFGSAPVPEPASLALFASGLFGLAGVMRRKLHKSS